MQPGAPAGASAAQAVDGDVHLFFLVGQSNMVGFGNGSALSAELLNRLQGLSRLTDPAPPVSFYAATHAGGASTTYGSASCVMDSEKGHRIMDRMDRDFQPVERLPLAPVQACRWEQDILRLDTRFGPEISLGLALNEQWPERNFVLSKRAVTGSSLAGDWTPNNNHSGYGALIADLVKIRAAYAPRRVTPAGLLWLQGEADSTDKAQAAAYRANLHSFIKHLREDMGEPFPVVITGLPMERHKPRRYQSDVERGFRDAERNLSPLEQLLNDGDPTSRDHLPIGWDGGVTRLGDKEFTDVISQLKRSGEVNGKRSIEQIRSLRDLACTHYSSSAQIRIGARAANAFARMSGQTPAASWPTDSWLPDLRAGLGWQRAKMARHLRAGRKGGPVALQASSKCRSTTSDEALDHWCEANCAVNFCPSDRCTCDGDPDPADGVTPADEDVADARLDDAGAESAAATGSTADERRAAAKRDHDARRAREKREHDARRAAAGAGTVPVTTARPAASAPLAPDPSSQPVLPAETPPLPATPPRTLYDWFWDKEKLLLANLPDVSSLDLGHTCGRLKGSDYY